MRLIDADALTDGEGVFSKYINTDSNFKPYVYVCDLIKVIDDMPTSFDLESVIAEIEKKLECIRKEQTADCSKYNGYWTEEQGIRSGMIKAHIEILEIIKSALSVETENGG